MSTKEKVFYAWMLGGMQVATVTSTIKDDGWFMAVLSLLFFGLFISIMISIEG